MTQASPDTKPLTDLQAKVLCLWNEGKTGGDIGQQVHLSRSAVLGLLARLRKRGYDVDPHGLHRVKGPGRPKKDAFKKRVVSLKAAAKAVVEESKNETPPKKRRGPRIPHLALPVLRPRVPETQASSGRWVDFFEVRPDGCKFPAGGGPYAFCNATRQPNSSYCAEHFNMTVDRVPRTIRTIFTHVEKASEQ
jgi:hypothetical protein